MSKRAKKEGERTGEAEGKRKKIQKKGKTRNWFTLID